MPYIDITAAKAELLAGTEPITLHFSTGDRDFPPSLPAEVEIEQLKLQRETRDLPADAQAPPGSEQRLMAAVFGDQYAEMADTIPQSELLLAFMNLMAVWTKPFADPNLGTRLMEGAGLPAGTILNGSSSITGGRSNPTSSASTGSTSPGPSGQNGSHGAASRRSTPGSRAKP